MLKRNKAKFILLLVVLILIAVGYVGSVVIKSKSNYIYKSYYAYKLPGPVSGGGLIFDVPIELKVQTSSNNQVELNHVWEINSRHGETYIAADSVRSKYKEPKDALIPINNYNVTTIKNFVSDRMPVGWVTSLGPQKPFKSNNIKNNAWVFNFSSSKNQNSIKGEVVYAISGSEYYFFLMSSNTSSWQPDVNVWGHIVNSLKIDQ